MEELNYEEFYNPSAEFYYKLKAEREQFENVQKISNSIIGKKKFNTLGRISNANNDGSYHVKSDGSFPLINVWPLIPGEYSKNGSVMLTYERGDTNNPYIMGYSALETPEEIEVSLRDAEIPVAPERIFLLMKGLTL